MGVCRAGQQLAPNGDHHGGGDADVDLTPGGLGVLTGRAGPA